jgi:hypothetical protein
MLRYILYLILIISVIKMYRFRLKSDENIIYSSLSLFVGILIIDWLVPKNRIEKFINSIKK